MERLLEACQGSWTSDIIRAARFLEEAHEVRTGCRKQRTSSRKRQATAGRRKAAKLDQPITW